MALCYDHSPTNNVARVRFPDLVSHKRLILLVLTMAQDWPLCLKEAEPKVNLYLETFSVCPGVVS